MGDCFQPILDKDDASLLAIAVRPCDTPHLMETIGLRELAGGADAPWPGQREVDRQGERLCVAAFLDCVGIAFDESRLDATYFSPSEATWAGGDRLVICVVEAHPSQPFNRSVRGSKR